MANQQEHMSSICDAAHHTNNTYRNCCCCPLQEWQAEAAAMLGRAEQLKVLLAHRQAHHISLLAALLQLMHRQEVQEFDSPQQTRSSDTAAAAAGEQAYCTLLLRGGASVCGAKEVAPLAAGSCKQRRQEQGQGIEALELGQPAVSPAQVVVAAALEAIEEAGDQEDDEFYMPVSSSSSSSIWCCQHSMHA
jgi:hypothetical protein